MDADRAAAEVAGAIGAGQLILLTNAWLLRISRMNLLSFPTSTARMLFRPRDRRRSQRKESTRCYRSAQPGGRESHFRDGRGEHPLLDALSGKGTTIS